MVVSQTVVISPCLRANRGNRMVGYDWSMLALVLGVAIFSSWRGLLWQLAHLGAFLVGGMLVYLYLDTAAATVSLTPPWNKLVAGVVLYAIGALFTYVAANACRRLLRRAGLESFDRHLGFVWGLCEGTLLALAITLIICYASTDPSAPVRQTLTSRVAYRAAAAAMPYLPERTVQRFMLAVRMVRSAATQHPDHARLAPPAPGLFLRGR